MDFSYSIEQIKKHPVQKKIELLNDIIIFKNKYEERIISIKNMFENEYPEYNNKNRNEIKNIVDDLIQEFRGYISSTLKSAHKKDLPKTILAICERELLEIEKTNIEIKKIEMEIQETQKTINIREKGRKLATKLESFKDQYIRNSETISKGQREWDCLVALVEDGTVCEHNLIDYGIDIATIKEPL